MSSKINFKHTSRLISLLLVLVMAVGLMAIAIVPASAETNTAVTDAANSLLQVRMVYKKDNVLYTIKSGSSFLINSTTILTCEHVISEDAEAIDLMEHYEGGKYKPSNVFYQVIVQKDVPIYATLKKYSAEDDYAILTLNDAINKPALKLADTTNVNPTDQVYALGFPGEVADIQYTNTFTSEDVTVSEGKVQKLSEYLGTDTIQHSARTTEGHSGGPLLDSDGCVIGINKGYSTSSDSAVQDRDYFYAVDMNQVRNVLDLLMIEYTSCSHNGATPEPETEANQDTTDATVITTTVPVTTTSSGGNDGPDTPPDMGQIIIIAAIVLLVVILAVVVVIIINSSKKNKAPATPAGPSVGAAHPGVPSTPSAPPVPPYAQPYNRPPMPPQGVAPTMANNEGAGETSVLNEGAGETTVLGGQATGFALVKVNGGQRVNINKPEFTIGKEKRRVDYCIADNNSISRTHAKLRIRAGKCYITDLGSTNCTFVNGTKLSPNQEVLLSNGDKIKFSDEEFEFVG